MVKINNNSFNKSKILSTGILIGISIIIILHRYLPIRASGEEMPKILHITNILQVGYLNTQIQSASSGFQIYMAELLIILDLDVYATRWISPIIGIFLFISFCFIIYSFIKNKIRGISWAVIIPITLFFIFASYIVAFMETSHKKYVLFFAFLLSFLLFRAYNYKREHRFMILILFLIMILTLYHYIWAIIWCGTFITGAYMSNMLHRKTLGMFGTLYMTSWVFTNSQIVPSMTTNPSILLSIFGNIDASVPLEAGSQITSWSSFSILGVNVPTVIIWMTGIWIVIIISILALIHTTIRFLNSKNSLYGKFFFGINAYISLFIIALFIRGDLPTIQRITKVIVIFSIIYWIRIYSEYSSNLIRKKEVVRKMLIILLILLLISVPLAIPRITQNGGSSVPYVNNTPIDNRYSFNEIAKLSFYDKYSENNCIRTYYYYDIQTAGILISFKPKFIGNNHNHQIYQIYNSGKYGRLACIKPKKINQIK